jgi:hypothetical protein
MHKIIKERQRYESRHNLASHNNSAARGRNSGLASQPVMGIRAWRNLGHTPYHRNNHGLARLHMTFYLPSS